MNYKYLLDSNLNFNQKKLNYRICLYSNIHKNYNFENLRLLNNSNFLDLSREMVKIYQIFNNWKVIEYKYKIEFLKNINKTIIIIKYKRLKKGVWII